MGFSSEEIAQSYAEDASRWEQLVLDFAGAHELELFTWTAAKLIEQASRAPMASFRVAPEVKAEKNRERVRRCIANLQARGDDALRTRRRRASSSFYARLKADAVRWAAHQEKLRARYAKPALKGAA